MFWRVPVVVEFALISRSVFNMSFSCPSVFLSTPYFSSILCGSFVILVFQVDILVAYLYCPPLWVQKQKLDEINRFRFQIELRWAYVHLWRFISCGLLQAATFRKTPSYAQKLIHNFLFQKKGVFSIFWVLHLLPNLSKYFFFNYINLKKI